MEYFYKRPHNSGKAVHDMTRRAAAWMLLVLLVLSLSLLTSCGEDPYAELPPEARGRTVITVGKQFDYGHFQQGLNKFNEAQDEIWVVAKTYMDPNTETNIKAATQRMYSELAAGNRPDLYWMVSFDAAALRKAGYIVDWYPIMEADPDFHMEDYQTNIWELLETDGCLYQLCTCFTMYGLATPPELYPGQAGWTLEEFADWMDANNLTLGRERLLQLMLWYGSQFEYIDLETKTCQFETPAFYELLAYLQTLPEDKSWDQDLRPVSITDPDMTESTHRLDGYYPRAVGLPSQNRTGLGVRLQDSYGLASDTKHRDACWTFVKWLLSYERQNEIGDSVPICRDAWESHLYRAGLDGDNEESLFYRSWNPWDKDKPYPAMPEEEIEYLRETVANASYVALSDYDDIAAVVEEEVLAYLAGDKTAEDCAHIIQSRVSTMLAEQE